MGLGANMRRLGPILTGVMGCLQADREEIPARLIPFSRPLSSANACYSASSRPPMYQISFQHKLLVVQKYLGVDWTSLSIPLFY